MKWSSFVYDGDTYDLSHLHPFDMAVIQEAKGNKPERVYNFIVEFSLHCFTHGSRTVGTDPALRYRDSRETRVFCFNRYALSKQLPGIIKNICGDKKCYHTTHGNYFIIELIDTGTGNVSQYEVYFTVSRSSKKKGSLNLYVQSAYIQTKEVKRKKPIRFGILAFKTHRNQPIKVPQ